jgi:nickel/cobalt transporter (NiCoT) family protein
MQNASLPHTLSSCPWVALFFFAESQDIGVIPCTDQMLFTAGMTLLDSVDSILMLYSYTGFPEHRFRLFEPTEEENEVPEEQDGARREAALTSIATTPVSQSPRDDWNQHGLLADVVPAPSQQSEQSGSPKQDKQVQAEDADARIREVRKRAQRELIVKRNLMSGLSIVLTLMSITVAFRYDSTSTTSGCNDAFC